MAIRIQTYKDQLNLGQLIEAIENLPLETVVEEGINHPHSYRGFYDELAFEPAEHVTRESMLDEARSAVGRTFTGWKGGEYTMGLETPVWLACVGGTGVQIIGLDES